eukprot:TRINITY_DN30857_c0_g1_i1.p1 TRINITY_DN30857_c0_g1~~TRINITY_DN30857_c0_g1_i1.p1  ORF type:complete len:569 (+),score=152.62 TRINITY_DN30857_c0_g1_i1:80-1786(+)
MCSFLVASFLLQRMLMINMTWVNELNRLRGPDATNVKEVAGWTFLHNLLHMTGERTLQPFTSDDGQVVALFNGEVYNWKELAKAAGGDWKSDGHSLLPLYLKYGKDFLQHARGEYAVVVADFRSNEIMIGTDAFMTKPMFVGHWQDSDGTDRFGVASYASPLLRLGAPSSGVAMATPNAVTSYSMKPPFEKLWTREVVHWDLKQFKTTTDDWVKAFERSVRRRSTGVIHGMFVGLSSGFDSGAVMLALHRQRTPFHAYTVRASEDQAIVEARVRYCRETATCVRLSSGALSQELDWLKENCEPYTYGTAVLWPAGPNRPMWEDAAAQGLSGIVRRVRKLGGLIYLSGSGADEIISDYAKGPGNCVGKCSFEGRWPSNLSDIFPWRNFYQGVQRDYLMKEELVGGAHGIETRYPFLDPEVVQEYLWLTQEAKLSVYKRPIHDYLTASNFPFNAGEKRGFGLSDVHCYKIRDRRGKKRVVCPPAPVNEESLSSAAAPFDPPRPDLPALTPAPTTAIKKLTSGSSVRESPPVVVSTHKDDPVRFVQQVGMLAILIVVVTLSIGLRRKLLRL